MNGIEESGRHLLELINDILDVSKIEVGQLELNVKNVSVKQVCKASLRLIERGAKKKNLNVLSSFDNAVELIQADERRLKQILVNLLSETPRPQGGAS